MTELNKYIGHLEKVAERKDWLLNPDRELVRELAKGLLVNKDRYGYALCPCRPATGDVKRDREIICPCIYAEKDIAEFGRCYCGLYISKEAFKNNRQLLAVIPDRHFEKYFS